MSTKITWLGHASVKIEFKNHIVFFDPWLDDNPACSLKVADVDKATVVCPTHGHIDHLGDSFALVKKTGATLICTPEIGFYADTHGLKEGEQVYSLNTSGTWRGPGFDIIMVPAAHTSEIMGEGWVAGPIQPGAGAIGYVLDIADGPSIYFGGDTGVSLEMGLIRDLYQPDVSILGVGGKYNMGPREAGYAAGLLGSRLILPIHYNTFPDQILDKVWLEREVAMRARRTRIVFINPGESFTVQSAPSA